MPEQQEKAGRRFLRTTKRIVLTTVRVTGIGIRIGFGVFGALAILLGGLLTWPLGLFIFGIPIGALGVMALFKSVFW